MNINQELVEKVKSGTHCIEIPNNTTVDNWNDFDILASRYFDDPFVGTGGKYYSFRNVGLYALKKIGKLIPIPLSSFFLPTPKMIPVEELNEFIFNVCITDGNPAKIIVDHENYKQFIKKYK
jgi:hypothetical protein